MTTPAVKRADAVDVDAPRIEPRPELLELLEAAGAVLARCAHCRRWMFRAESIEHDNNRAVGLDCEGRTHGEGN